MRSILALALVGGPLGLSAGCFYVDPINQRPSLDIEREGSGEIYRGDPVMLKAIANDPEGETVYYKWRAYLCDAQVIGDLSAPRPGCDAAPFATSLVETLNFMVRPRRADVDEPVHQVLILLEGQDAYGATAKPTQQLTLAISDHAPELVLRKDSRYSYVVDTDINIYAKYGDPDPGETATVEWKVYTPVNMAPYMFTDLDLMEAGQLGKKFRPQVTGDWEIEATATDDLGNQTVDRVMITVVPDHPPCLSQWAPIDAPAGSTLPMTDPTLFQVTVVQDDLDPWPLVPDDPVLGPPAFHWSILPPGASTRQSLSATGDHVALDPASYSPGDIVELRVEIEDRKHIAVNCADASPTCSVISDNSCIQRLTWRVEVR